MEFDAMFWLALQSSLFLGIIHGINPCGHSWLVVAPFVVGDTNGKRAFTLTTAFLIGTTVACLLIGLTLGAVSMSLPPSAEYIVSIITGAVIIILGAILLVKPELLHHHDHDHDHDHSHHHDDDHHHCDHDHDHHHHDHGDCHDDHDHEHTHSHHSHGTCESHGHGCGCSGHGIKLGKAGAASAFGLFSIGFVNMIVPCPTVAIMYSYAIDSGSWQKATSVFAAYALTTAIAVGGVIFVLRRAADMVKRLEKPWLESAIMRTAGLLTIGFGVYSLIIDLG